MPFLAEQQPKEGVRFFWSFGGNVEWDGEWFGVFWCSSIFFGKQRIILYNSKYPENQLLLISINFTPKTSHSCLKQWYTRFSRYIEYM